MVLNSEVLNDSAGRHMSRLDYSRTLYMIPYACPSRNATCGFYQKGIVVCLKASASFDVWLDQIPEIDSI